MCWGLNCNYIHIIEDGHQPNSRGLYTYYKDFPLQVDDHHQYNMFWLWAGLYIPRTQMTLVLIGKGLVLEGLTFKNTVEVIGALGIYIYIHIYISTRTLKLYVHSAIFQTVDFHGCHWPSISRFATLGIWAPVKAPYPDQFGAWKVRDVFSGRWEFFGGTIFGCFFCCSNKDHKIHLQIDCP